MVYDLISEIRHCYERADVCSRRADEADCDEQRDAYLLIAERWVALAREYELTGRLIGNRDAKSFALSGFTSLH